MWEGLLLPACGMLCIAVSPRLDRWSSELAAGVASTYSERVNDYNVGVGVNRAGASCAVLFFDDADYGERSVKQQIDISLKNQCNAVLLTDKVTFFSPTWNA